MTTKAIELLKAYQETGNVNFLKRYLKEIKGIV